MVLPVHVNAICAFLHNIFPFSSFSIIPLNLSVSFPESYGMKEIPNQQHSHLRDRSNLNPHRNGGIPRKRDLYMLPLPV
jgi:hypothetical protein